MFEFLRLKYYKHRNLPFWFTLRCVKSVSLTKVSMTILGILQDWAF